MLYSVTHTATRLHGLRSGTSSNLLLRSHFNVQSKTPLHGQSESQTRRTISATVSKHVLLTKVANTRKRTANSVNTAHTEPTRVFKYEL